MVEENEIIRNISKTAPEYKFISKGMNLEGTCQNKGCKAFNKKAWFQAGYSDIFPMPEIVTESTCPLCKTYMKDVCTSAFYLCKVTIISGKKKDDKNTIRNKVIVHHIDINNFCQYSYGPKI